MRKLNSVALSRKVLAVSVDNGHDWAAYIDAVPGINHDNEDEQVSRTGTKLSKEVAKVLFPNMDMAKWRR